jgi:hypothetical protein
MEKYIKKTVSESKFDWFLFFFKSQNPVIASVGGNRNALYIYPKDNVSVVILTNLVGSRPENFIEEIAQTYT